MDSFEKWRKTLKSGNYRRKVNKYQRLRTARENGYQNNNRSGSVSSNLQKDLLDEKVPSSHTEDLPASLNLDGNSSDDDSDIPNEFIDEYSPDRYRNRYT